MEDEEDEEVKVEEESEGFMDGKRRSACSINKEGKEKRAMAKRKKGTKRKKKGLCRHGKVKC